jgi:hypothetical protein
MMMIIITITIDYSTMMILIKMIIRSDNATSLLSNSVVTDNKK